MKLAYAHTRAKLHLWQTSQLTALHTRLFSKIQKIAIRKQNFWTNQLLSKYSCQQLFCTRSINTFKQSAIFRPFWCCNLPQTDHQSSKYFNRRSNATIHLKRINTSHIYISPLITVKTKESLYFLHNTAFFRKKINFFLLLFSTRHTHQTQLYSNWTSNNKQKKTVNDSCIEHFFYFLLHCTLFSILLLLFFTCYFLFFIEI